jgi:hypothetical protein
MVIIFIIKKHVLQWLRTSSLNVKVKGSSLHIWNLILG